jgi:hypothetical protein
VSKIFVFRDKEMKTSHGAYLLLSPPPQPLIDYWAPGRVWGGLFLSKTLPAAKDDDVDLLLFFN